MGNAVLLVQRRDRLGPRLLAAARMYNADRRVRPDRGQRVPDEIAALIAFSNNTVTAPLIIGIQGAACPSVR
jgi:hypothetical protein